jgi:hypothetical protein
VLSPDLGPKRLQILREVIANLARVVYLANPDNASNMAALVETNIAASAAGTVLIPVEVRVVDDFEPAFAAIVRERPDAVLVSNDSLSVGFSNSLERTGCRRCSSRRRAWWSARSSAMGRACQICSGAPPTHFLMKRLPKVATEMALHVLAYNLTRVGRNQGIVRTE